MSQGQYRYLAFACVALFVLWAHRSARQENDNTEVFYYCG